MIHPIQGSDTSRAHNRSFSKYSAALSLHYASTLFIQTTRPSGELNRTSVKSALTTPHNEPGSNTGNKLCPINRQNTTKHSQIRHLTDSQPNNIRLRIILVGPTPTITPRKRNRQISLITPITTPWPKIQLDRYQEQN